MLDEPMQERGDWRKRPLGFAPLAARKGLAQRPQEIGVARVDLPQGMIRMRNFFAARAPIAGVLLVHIAARSIALQGFIRSRFRRFVSA